MTEDIYRRLQQQLDQYSMGFPETASGIEIRILQYLFTEQEAKMFTLLTPMLETARAVSPRMGCSEEAVGKQLAGMADKGLLFCLKKGEEDWYGAIPFVHGLFEFQVKKLQPTFAAMARQYFDEAFDSAMQKGAEYFLRTIPVHQSVDVTHHVATHEDALAILREKSAIVVTDCICRKTAGMVDHDCGKPIEACFMFGSMGQYYLDRGMGRKIFLEEAEKILADCREAGLVTQPATSRNPGGMCNCCGDCCGVLRALNKHPKPVDLVFSNHFARVNADACTGCETCMDRCQMEALAVSEKGRARVDPDRCIGCGLCVSVCPVEALSLTPKSGPDYRTPPESMTEQMMLLARKRGVI
jgi:Na+-translocating ferredoxin:NAD+ oxidoreductase subunit B